MTDEPTNEPATAEQREHKGERDGRMTLAICLRSFNDGRKPRVIPKGTAQETQACDSSNYDM